MNIRQIILGTLLVFVLGGCMTDATVREANELGIFRPQEAFTIFKTVLDKHAGLTTGVYRQLVIRKTKGKNSFWDFSFREFPGNPEEWFDIDFFDDGSSEVITGHFIKGLDDILNNHNGTFSEREALQALQCAIQEQAQVVSGTYRQITISKDSQAKGFDICFQKIPGNPFMEFDIMIRPDNRTELIPSK